MVEGGQRCSLVLHGQTRRRIRIQAGGGEWGTALAALAAVRADADQPLSTMVRDALGATGAAEAVDAARLYVVTAALNAGLAARLLAHALGPPRRGRRVGGRARPSPASSGCRARPTRPRCGWPGRACRWRGWAPATTSAMALSSAIARRAGLG